MSRRSRLLVVEDDPDLAFGLRMNLELEGYDVDVAHDGGQATTAFHHFRPELIILDLMLPDMDGMELLRGLRASDEHTVVIILSARANEADRVAGLRMGADDYVTKPFSVMELLERVKRHLRRTISDRCLHLGDARIDLESHIVDRDGQTHRLSEKECALLGRLIKAQGATVSKEQLLREVWGHKVAVDTRTVDVHIATLRKKLEANPKNPRFILTVHKKGYRVQPAPLL